MKKIPLSQGKFAIVDDEDYEHLNQWKWCCTSRGYASRHRRKGEKCPGRVVYMHRVILERMGFKDFESSDHINRNQLDNRRCNLRSVTQRENLHNQGKRSNNTSGYKGVTWAKHATKWRAQMQLNGKYKHIGYFDDKKEAARAYNKAAKKHHGEFAVLNEV